MKRLLPIAAGLLLLAASPAISEEKPITFQIDSAHSSIVFRIQHMGINFVHGRFNDYTGEFVVNPDQPGGEAACRVEVQTASVDTAVEARDEHLRQDDFFHVAEHPTMSFVSTGWKQTGEAAFELTGDFTMMATTKEITVPVTLHGTTIGRRGNLRAGFTTSFTIQRSDYGMTGHEGIGETVHITLDIQGIHALPKEEKKATKMRD